MKSTKSKPKASVNLPMEAWPKSAPNMVEASRLTGIHRTTFGNYKREGAAGFKADGRIDLHALRDWMLAHGREAGEMAPAELTAARIRLLNAQAARVERENRIKDGLMVSRKDVEFGLNKVMAAMFSVLERMANELPAACVGMDEVAICEKVKEQIDTLKSDLSEKFRILETTQEGAPPQEAQAEQPTA